MAGINAARTVQGKPPVILGRDQAYLGVMIDDLVTKGTQEPYRMFTSRAEYRLHLRQDNADLRLTELAGEIGLAGGERVARVRAKAAQIAEALAALQARSPMVETWAQALKRPAFSWKDLPEGFARFPAAVAAHVESEVKYAGYFERERAQIDRLRRAEDAAIPDWLDYSAIQGLKAEARAKLQAIRPRTLGQAARISGINPTDLALVQVWMGRGKGGSHA